MSNEYQEPEEKDLNDKTEDVILDDFNPLDEPVLEKEYTKHNVTVNPNDFVNDIPEPSFVPPPIGGSLKQDEKVKKEPEPFNPELKDLPKKDKLDASARVAEMIVDGYSLLNDVVDKTLLFNEKKVRKLVKEDKLNLSIPVPVKNGVTMTAGEFIEEYNEQTKGTISVSPQFREEVTPLLTNYLAKKGIGMSEDNMLWYVVAKEVTGKIFMYSQGYSIKKDILNNLIEQTELMRASVSSTSTAYTPPPPPPQSTPQPQYQEAPTQPQYTQQQTYNPDLNVNDFVNQMTGGIPPRQQVVEDVYDDVETDDSDYVEPKPKIKVIKSSSTKTTKKGRPKKK